MSLLRNLMKSVTPRSGCATQLTANFSRRVAVCKNQPKRKHGNETQNLAKLQKDSKFRYVIKDKTNWGTPFISSLPKIYSRNRMENKYVWSRAILEKKKCFEEIEKMKKRCRPIKNFHVMPQTIYDPGQPTLWMNVKDMYTTTSFFVHPNTLYRVVQID